MTTTIIKKEALDKVMALLPDQKIQAIKELRMLTAWGLKESKDAIDWVCPYSTPKGTVLNVEDLINLLVQEGIEVNMDLTDTDLEWIAEQGMPASSTTFKLDAIVRLTAQLLIEQKETNSLLKDFLDTVTL